MAKFYGPIGYAVTVETQPGLWEEQVTERSYSGDVIRNSGRWVNGEKVNDDLAINNQISVVADPFAYENFHAMKYIRWMGASWKITNVDIQRPRLVLSIGGVYNGEMGPTSGAT